MKRLKRALSLTKSAPRIEESIAEIDEHSLKDSFLDPLNENDVGGGGGIQFKTTCNGNNNKSNNTTTSKSNATNNGKLAIFNYELLGLCSKYTILDEFWS